MKIIVSGPAVAFDPDALPILAIDTLQGLHGLEDAGAVCAEHLDSPLSDIGIEGGTLRLDFVAHSKALRVVTEYRSPRKLSQPELQELIEYTLGQWSDGIGTDCFSAHRDATGISVSVYPIPYDSDAVRIEQIDDGTKARRPSPLFALIRKGDITKLAKALERGEDLEAQGKWGHTPLMFAVSNNQPAAVELLIARGANVNHQAPDRTTSIQLAAMQANVGMLTALIEAGARINVWDERGATPLMWAANRGPLEAVDLLVRHEAEIDARDLTGETALMYAPPEQMSIVEFLLAQGADPNVRTHDGLTASQHAMKQSEMLKRAPLGSDPARAKLFELKAQLLHKAGSSGK